MGKPSLPSNTGNMGNITVLLCRDYRIALQFLRAKHL